MIPYAQSTIFSTREQYLYHEAARLVEAIPDHGTEWRCHEVARAIGAHLDLVVVDGKLGAVEHTWLLTNRIINGLGPNGPASVLMATDQPHILDVYVPGALPQVQLLDSFGLLAWAEKYVAGATRDDIRVGDIKCIEHHWRANR